MKVKFSVTETVTISYFISYNEEVFKSDYELEQLIIDVYNGNPWQALALCNDIYDIEHNQIEDHLDTDNSSIEYWR